MTSVLRFPVLARRRVTGHRGAQRAVHRARTGEAAGPGEARDHEAGAAAAEEARRAAEARAASRSAAAIGVSATSNEFDQDVPFALFAEEATITGPVSVSRGPRFDVSAGFRVWRRFGAGVTLTSFNSSGDMEALFRLPHPFL